MEKRPDTVDAAIPSKEEEEEAVLKEFVEEERNPPQVDNEPPEALG